MPTIRMAVAAFLALIACAATASAQKKYDPGASDTEIKLGQTMHYSGPLSGFITLAKAEIAYFAMINEQGGANGRKIGIISRDDGFSPPKTVEQTRRLVEEDQVLAISGSPGTQAMVQVLKQCGDNLTRDNVMKQAANLKQFHPAMLLKDINMDTSPTANQPMEEMALQRFNGERFEVFGELLSARVGGK